MYVFVKKIFFSLLLLALHSSHRWLAVGCCCGCYQPVNTSTYNDNETWNVTNGWSEWRQKKSDDVIRWNFPSKAPLNPCVSCMCRCGCVFMRRNGSEKSESSRKKSRSQTFLSQFWIDKSSNNFSIWLESCLFNPFDGFAVSFRGICKRRFHVNRNIRLPMRWLGFHNISNSVEAATSESDRERAT